MTVVTSYNRNTAMPYVYLTENQEKNKFKRIVTCPPKPILEGHDTCLSKKISPRVDSNHGPLDLQSSALPTELLGALIYHELSNIHT